MDLAEVDLPSRGRPFFLEARGLEVHADVRERVLASTNLAELDRWIRRAAVVTDARELLATNGS